MFLLLQACLRVCRICPALWLLTAEERQLKYCTLQASCYCKGKTGNEKKGALRSAKMKWWAPFLSIGTQLNLCTLAVPFMLFRGFSPWWLCGSSTTQRSPGQILWLQTHASEELNRKFLQSVVSEGDIFWISGRCRGSKGTLPMWFLLSLIQSIFQ